MTITYPAGWDRGFAVRGREADGTARVPFALPRDEVQQLADRAAAAIGHPMQVIADGPAWAYRPLMVPPLTINQSRAGYQWLAGRGIVCNDITHHKGTQVADLIAAHYPGGIAAFKASGREPVVTPAYPWEPRTEPCRREACVRTPDITPERVPDRL